MQSVVLRGGLIAAAATVLALGYGLAPDVNAQQVATAEAADADAEESWQRRAPGRRQSPTSSTISSRRAARPGARSPTTTRTRCRARRVPNNRRGLGTIRRRLQSERQRGSADEDLSRQRSRHPSTASTWRAKRTSTAVTPVAGANWEQFAAKGAAGCGGTDRCDAGARHGRDRRRHGSGGPTGATSHRPAGPNTWRGTGASQLHRRHQHRHFLAGSGKNRAGRGRRSLPSQHRNQQHRLGGQRAP